VFDFDGNELACVRNHEGFLGKRISSVLCIDWNSNKVIYFSRTFIQYSIHICTYIYIFILLFPFKNEIVFGAQDSTLSIFSNAEN